MKKQNTAYLKGKIKDISHNISKGLTKGVLMVYRTSGIEDMIPFEMSYEPCMEVGANIELRGRIATRNVRDRIGKSHKEMFIKVDIWNTCEDSNPNCNEVEFFGVLVKKDRLRSTPMGKTIMDVVFAINDESGESYYPSAIAWLNTAIRLEDQPIGTPVHIQGRFQSRQYQKIVGTDIEIRTAYEISVSRLEVL